MSLFSMFFFISLYMQQVLGYERAQGRAVAYLPLALAIIISAGIASRAHDPDRRSSRC